MEKLNYWLAPMKYRRCGLEELMTHILIHFNVSIEEVRTGPRTRRLVKARRALLFLSMKHTNANNNEACAFINTTYTSGCYHKKKAYQMLRKKGAFERDINAIEKNLI